MASGQRNCPGMCGHHRNWTRSQNSLAKRGNNISTFQYHQTNKASRMSSYRMAERLLLSRHCWSHPNLGVEYIAYSAPMAIRMITRSFVTKRRRNPLESLWLDAMRRDVSWRKTIPRSSTSRIENTTKTTGKRCSTWRRGYGDRMRLLRGFDEKKKRNGKGKESLFVSLFLIRSYHHLASTRAIACSNSSRAFLIRSGLVDVCPLHNFSLSVKPNFFHIKRRITILYYDNSLARITQISMRSRIEISLWYCHQAFQVRLLQGTIGIYHGFLFQCSRWLELDWELL